MKFLRPLFLLLLVTVLCNSAYADGHLPYETASAVNPLYSEYTMEEEAPVLFGEESEAPDYEDYLTTLNEVGAALRQGMVERKSTIVLYYALDTYLAKEDMSGLFSSAFYETDQPNEGDYLKWSWQRYNVTYGGKRVNDVNYYTITFTVSYYTTLQEETVVGDKINSILASFAFQPTDSDYVKIKRVYDYICANVTYDHDGFNTLFDGDTTNDDYSAVTAYKALTKGTAVCQGYATLFYRMIETLGIDARVIAGTSRSQSHAWNIVKIGDRYYNLDSTWDAGKSEYIYFLRSPSSFASQHSRYDEYATASFHFKYPMGGDYSCVLNGHEIERTVTGATCKEYGYTTYYCKTCSTSYVSDYTAPVHIWDKGKVTKSVSATVSGEKTYTCSRCRETKTEEIPATGPCDRGIDCVSRGFPDASAHWGHDAIDYVVYNGLMNGTGAGFEPETTMSRAMLVTVLYRYAGEPEPGSNDFSDVPGDTWYTDAVSWAANHGVVTGTGDGSTFSPDVPVTREQLATILYRYADAMDADVSARANLSKYPDNNNVASWSADAVKWAVASGIISGAQRDGINYLDPGIGANRAVVATIMMRFIQIILE